MHLKDRALAMSIMADHCIKVLKQQFTILYGFSYFMVEPQNV